MAIAAPLTPLPGPLVPTKEFAQARGLLITSEAGFVRGFRRALKQGGHAVRLDVYTTFEDATVRDRVRYDWIVLDLDGVGSPMEAVETIRRVWQGTFVAVVRRWWDEKELIPQAHADHVLHKPARAAEIDTMFRPAPLGAVATPLMAN